MFRKDTVRRELCVCVGAGFDSGFVRTPHGKRGGSVEKGRIRPNSRKARWSGKGHNQKKQSRTQQGDGHGWGGWMKIPNQNVIGL